MILHVCVSCGDVLWKGITADHPPPSALSACFSSLPLLKICTRTKWVGIYSANRLSYFYSGDSVSKYGCFDSIWHWNLHSLILLLATPVDKKHYQDQPWKSKLYVVVVLFHLSRLTLESVSFLCSYINQSILSHALQKSAKPTTFILVLFASPEVSWRPLEEANLTLWKPLSQTIKSSFLLECTLYDLSCS